jgi:hypothetical protein
VSVLSIILFLVFTVSTNYPGSASSQESDAERFYKEGIRSFENGEYNKAIEWFMKALELTQDKQLQTETYVYLSLVNFYLGDSYNSHNWIKKALDNDPGKEVSSRFSSDYIDLFNKTKSEYAKEVAGKQREAEEAKVEETEKPEPRTVAVKAGKKEGSKKTLLMIGGALVAGAAVLLMVLKPWSADTGSIQVSSEPAGATVKLDDKPHSEKTNCKIEGLEPGTYNVKVDLEDYSMYEEDVVVEAGKTVEVSVPFKRPGIEVTSPDSSTTWTTGERVKIIWDTKDFPYSISAAGMIQELKHVQKMVRLFQIRSLRSNSPSRNISDPRREIRNGVSKRDNRTRDVNTPHFSKSMDKSGDENILSGVRNPRNVNLKNLNISSFSQKIKLLSKATSLKLERVRIELFKSENLEDIITTNTINSGEYDWDIPPLESGSDYKIRVTSANYDLYNVVFDYSDAFTIESDETL